MARIRPIEVRLAQAQQKVVRMKTMIAIKKLRKKLKEMRL